MKAKNAINSDAYWDSRFAEDWESNHGPAQSRFFARLAIENLPSWLLEQLQRQPLTLCDWGCAQGDGTDIWASYVNSERITGIDFSSVAVDQAIQRYPAIRFLNEDWLTVEPGESTVFDIVFSSNTLEHFHKPYAVLRSLCKHATKALVLALPYRELDRHHEHFYTFLPANIPTKIDGGFRLVWSRVVDCRQLPNTLWGGDQIVLVYAKSDWVDSLALTLQDFGIEQSNSASAIASLNQAVAERDVQIASFNQAVTERDGQIASLNQAVAERDGQIVSLNQAVAERDGQIASLNQAVTERDGQIANLNKAVTERDGQIASLNQAVTERDGQIASLNQAVAERDGQIASLNQAVTERDSWLNQATNRLNDIQASNSWRMTAPLRYLVGYRENISAQRQNSSTPQLNDKNSRFSLERFPRVNYLAHRFANGIRRHGLFGAIPKGVGAASVLGRRWVVRKLDNRTYQQRLKHLARIIRSHNAGFVDIFHVPMGWSTPLFQRFQHMSLQAASLNGLALYGGHIQVDTDMRVFKQAEGNVIVFDALDHLVVTTVFDALRDVRLPKILRLQSIDLATTIADVIRLIDDGFVVVYEYIDEISDEITGAIPEFVIERHKWLLSNEQVLVVATSSKLHREAMRYRSTPALLSTNGVDLDHWRQPVGRIPVDMEPARNSGKCVVGYHGALARWIDFDLIRRIADDERYHVVLIGYEHDESFRDSGLDDHPCVSFLGSKSYFDLNKYAAHYDVAILPFKRYELTESVSPVKLFEYMAAGKPVVTTDLQECFKYESCLVSDTSDLFMENLHIAAAAKNDPEYLAVLAAEANKNSWHEKAISVFRQSGVNNLPVVEVQGTPLESDDIPLDMKTKISSPFYKYLRKMFWSLPIADDSKERLITAARSLGREIRGASQPRISLEGHGERLESYVSQVLSTPKKVSSEYVGLGAEPFVRADADPKLLAYYLPQFHPTKENDEWWGLGTTEWNNVSRAVPQFVGHYQPRLPGELGYYDLRIEDNLVRQVELARNYGLFGFAFYYYWFDGVRLLDKPLDMFVESKRIDFPFCLCWANESWTRRFDGTCGEILMKQSETVESYSSFIDGAIEYMKSKKYIRVDGRPLLIIYRPSLVPDCAYTLKMWRARCIESDVGSPYIIGVKENTWLDKDLLALGFDAQTEFHPGTVFHQCSDISASMNYVRQDFGGLVMDYADIVSNKKYFNYDFPKMYRAVMPMWDNTARRDNKGMIFHGASPALYKQWLKDVITYQNSSQDLPDRFVFINAWNEWGEGAYLEPDRYYGYAYLNATKEALEESR